MDWRALGGVAAVVVVVALAGPGTAVPNIQLTVEGVGVDPGQPAVGDPVTLTPTVQSSVGNDEPVEITAVNATIDGEEIDRKRNFGTLSPGGALSVPFTTTFDEPGTYTVTFTFVGTDDTGEEVTVTREETVVVSAVPAVRLTVNEIDVQPATPTAGAPVTVPVTVDSSAGSRQPLDVQRVELREDNETLVSAGGVGSISTGGSITVPLTTTFKKAGQKQLTARLTGTNANGESVSVTQPVQIVVETGEPTLEVTNPQAVEETASTVSMTVSNPTQNTLRNIVATVSTDGAETIVSRRVVPTLAGGGQTDLSFRIRPEVAGETLLRTNVSYTTAAGTTANKQRTTVVPVRPLQPDVSVRVETQRRTQSQDGQNLDIGVDGILDAGGGQQQGSNRRGAVAVVVSNLGNAPVRDVVLDPRVDNTSLGPRPVTDELSAGGEAAVTVSLAQTPPSEVVFEAAYDVGTNRSSAITTFDPAGSRGSVSVTGIDLETDGREVEITGDIGNTGGGSVSGVVVAVNSGDGVSPVYPNRDFFVGEVDENAFAPFELTAEVTENASEIPLEVTYFVDGDGRTEQLTLPLEEPVSPEPDDSPSIAIVAAVVGMLLLLSGVIVLFVRRP